MPAFEAPKTPQERVEATQKLRNWVARPEQSPSREYVGFEIEVAQILAEKMDKPLVETARDYTTLLHQYLWEGTDNYIDAENMTPVELAEALYEREKKESAKRLPLEYHEDTRYGCFLYHHQIDVPVVDIHFQNAESDTVSPLSVKNIENRRRELEDMLTEIKRDYPDTKEVEGRSWLYNSESYRHLFPDSYTEHREEVIAETARDISGGSAWGQFMDHTLGLKKELADQFIANLKALDEVTPETIGKAFPLRTYRVRGPIEDFYTKYGI